MSFEQSWSTLDREAALELAVKEAQTEITQVISAYASRIMGHLRVGTPGVTLDDFKADLERQSSTSHRAEWCLTRLRLCQRLGMDLAGDVLNARQFGASWEDIADAAEVTPAEARTRWDQDDH